jgi:hypothetical protein
MLPVHPDLRELWGEHTDHAPRAHHRRIMGLLMIYSGLLMTGFGVGSVYQMMPR